MSRIKKVRLKCLGVKTSGYLVRALVRALAVVVDDGEFGFLQDYCDVLVGEVFTVFAAIYFDRHETASEERVIVRSFYKFLESGFYFI